MADPRFFKNAGPISLVDIIKVSGCQLLDGVTAPDSFSLSDVAPLSEATADKLSFFDNKKYLDAFTQTKAGACFVRPEFAANAPSATVCLLHKNPYKAYALAAALFYPSPSARAERAASAVIDPTATIGRDVSVGAYTVIAAGVQIGDRVRIGAHVVIGEGVVIGDDTVIDPHVTITHSIIGKNVRVYTGARLGQPGFGFAIDPAGFVPVPQLGRVIIEDDVAIGANTTVDRGAGPDTVIGRGSRLDNLVHIAHNVKLGRQCILAAQTGIAGSSELGDFVMVGGQVGISGHLKVGKGARIGAQSGVIQNIPAGIEVMGTPSVPLKQFLRQSILVQKMAENAVFKKEEK